MKILMLVNWKVEYTDKVPEDKQPPDYYVEGQPYWFFRYFNQLEEQQVDVVDIRSFPMLERFEKNLLRFYIWQTLKCIPKLGKYDLILSHGMQSGIVLCMWRRLFGKGKYRHIVFDIGAFNSGREKGRGLGLMQFASKSLDGVIYHTASQKAYYEKCHPWLLPKSRFIPFGTDTDFFTPDEGRQDSVEKETYILCVGYYKRDWDTLLEAYRKLKENESIKDIRLRLIGNCNIKSEIESVEVWDQVTVTELKRQIQNALFCVLPLQQFNYSYGQMTLLQQMALGKAVIVADVSSIQAYKGEGNLILYEPENVEELAASMREILSDPHRREQIGRKAKESVRMIYNERNMAKEIYSVIKEWMEEE